MKKNFLFIVIVLIIFCSKTYGQSINIKTKDVSHKDYYTGITYLNEGDTNDNGKAYRILICTSEIYDDLIIETVTIGEEGGNVKIISRRQIDIDSFWNAFHLKGEISGLKFVKWLNANSFILEAQDRKFVFKNIGSVTPRVSVAPR